MQQDFCIHVAAVAAVHCVKIVPFRKKTKVLLAVYYIVKHLL